MKNRFLQLVKKELFYYSIQPVFYIAAVVFILFSSLQFFILQQFFIPGTGTTDLHRFFNAIPYICIIILPALVLHNDLESFDETLPVSMFDIVFSRWLAAFTAFMLMLFPLIMIPVCVNIFGFVDFGQIITGFSGILFYAGAALSCIVFLTEFQKGASYIISAIVLAVSNLAHLVPLYFSLPPAISVFFRTVSFAWHFDAAGKGIIDTRDYIFYIAITIIFLLLATFGKEHHKGMPCRAFKLKTIFCLLLLVFLDNSRYYIRIDLTAGKQFSVSDYSKENLKSLDRPIRITYYRSDDLSHIYPQVNDIYDFLLDYSRLNKNISIKMVDPGKRDIYKTLEAYGIIPQSFRSATGSKTEYLQVYSAIVIEYLDKYEVIPFILSTSSLEYDLDSRILHLVKNRYRKVYLLCGNGLDLNTDYSYVIPWLESQEFICNIITAGQLKNILTDSDAVLAVFGSSALTEKDSYNIENFLLEGGRVLFASSPFSVNISKDWSVKFNHDDTLLPLLSANGIEFGHQLVADGSCARITMYDNDKQQKILDYPLWIDILPQGQLPSGMTLYWVTPVFTYKKNIQPIILTSRNAWLIDKNSKNTDSLFETNPFLVSTIPEKDFSGQFMEAALFNGPVTGYYTGSVGIPTQFIILADQYFVNSSVLSYTENGNFRNLEALTNFLLVLHGEKDLAALQSRHTVNTMLYKIKSPEVFTSKKNMVLIIHCIVLPGLFIFLSILSLIKRRIDRDSDVYEKRKKIM